jgi:hypothetical protein
MDSLSNEGLSSRGTRPSPDHTRQMFERRQEKEIKDRYDKLDKQCVIDIEEAADILEKLSISSSGIDKISNILLIHANKASKASKLAEETIREKKNGKEVLDSLRKFEEECKFIASILAKSKRKEGELKIVIAQAEMPEALNNNQWEEYRKNLLELSKTKRDTKKYRKIEKILDYYDRRIQEAANSRSSQDQGSGT